MGCQYGRCSPLPEEPDRAVARILNRFDATDGEVARRLRPRDDVVGERRTGDGTFEAAHGPFRHYRREVEVGEPGADGRRPVVERIAYRTAVPYFGWLFAIPTRRALRRPGTGAQPWWAPPARLDASAANALGVLAAATLTVGYLNTLLTQTITFAADEFGSSDSAQGVSLAVVRSGILLALVIVPLADRRGRRAVILGTAVAAPLVCALGGLAPDLGWLTATQAVGRPLALSLGIAIGIVAAEEMPAGSRAYAVSMLSMSTGLGAGLCVLALALADTGAQGWRLLYALPLGFLALVPGIRRRLGESRRFVAPHAEARLAGHGRRFWLLAASGLLLNLLVAPASAFQNRYLKRERGFSAARISLFTVSTNTPAGLGIVVGGRLADRRGRRVVGAVALLGGSVATVATFLVSGAGMWLCSLAGAIIGGASVPALGVYSAELFPTGARGRANAALMVLTLTGSAVGLVAAGFLADRWDRFGPAMALMGVGPLVVFVLVLAWFPETAGLELEQLNPEDAPRPGPVS